MRNSEILSKLTEIEKLLRKRDDKLLNATEAAQYLSISNSHLYKLTCQKKIPFHKPSGKYLYFFKRELNEWIHQNDPHPNPLPAGEGKEDNEPGLFDEETNGEDEAEPP